MNSVNLPLGAWDCHIHCFDPVRFPFSPDRAYTPTPASLKSLVEQTRADNIVLVQASIEDGSQGLLAHLAQCQAQFSSLTVRGIICNDKTNLKGLTPQDFERLHCLGIRSIRIHGFHSTDGQDITRIETQIRDLAVCDGVRKYAWTISAQLPLETWASLEPFIMSCKDIANTMLIADHNGYSTPEDIEGHSLALESFVKMLKSGRLYVKVGALYRRSQGGDIRTMEPIIRRFAEEASLSLLWGSDWPHVDSSKKGLETAKPHPGADTSFELRLLREWLTATQWRQMLVENPRRVFEYPYV